ncbi:hypothetical protein J6590_010748 [Homalodisca vitripennis]|nr:hypothetical protein J6590_010748 [Homalodisca vitripennis]
MLNLEHFYDLDLEVFRAYQIALNGDVGNAVKGRSHILRAAETAGAEVAAPVGALTKHLIWNVFIQCASGGSRRRMLRPRPGSGAA